MFYLFYLGGSVLYIESSLRQKYPQIKLEKTTTAQFSSDSKESRQHSICRGSLEATGNLGDIITESMRTAYTVAKNILAKRDPMNEFLELAHIHVHIPEVLFYLENLTKFI